MPTPTPPTYSSRSARGEAVMVSMSALGSAAQISLRRAAVAHYFWKLRLRPDQPTEESFSVRESFSTAGDRCRLTLTLSKRCRWAAAQTPFLLRDGDEAVRIDSVAGATLVLRPVP